MRRVHPAISKDRKPVAYYLPLENFSPIKFGKTILREAAPNNIGTPSLQDRDILSRYMSSVDSGAAQSKRTMPRGSKEVKNLPKLSLQEALRSSRPNFILRSERRVAILKQIQRMREIRAEKQEVCLDQVRCLSPTSRKDAILQYSPVPVIKLFSHKEMVLNTKHKYSGLPEATRREETKKKDGKNRNNLLRKEMYSRQLKKRLAKGKVSLLHHDRVL